MLGVLLAGVAFACTRSDPQTAAGPDVRNGVVAFVRSQGRVADLMTIDPDGGGSVPLGPSAGTIGSPSWAPDGSRLAFVWRRWPSGFNVFVMEADGSDTIRITDGLWIDASPTWSPDAGSVAFSSNRSEDVGSGIYVVDLDDRLLRWLVEGIAPDWSPTGGRIAFVRILRAGADVFTVGLDGTGLRNVTDTPGEDRDPDWSPNGSAIVFASNRDGDLDLYVMDPDGGNLRQLTDDPADELWPEWSPDGTRIAYTRTTGDTSEIWVVGADGSRPVRLTQGPRFDSTPAWQPVPAEPR